MRIFQALSQCRIFAERFFNIGNNLGFIGVEVIGVHVEFGDDVAFCALAFGYVVQDLHGRVAFGADIHRTLDQIVDLFFEFGIFAIFLLLVGRHLLETRNNSGFVIVPESGFVFDRIKNRSLSVFR